MSQHDIDDEPEPTEEERRAAEELARALDAKGDAAPGTDAAFASALRATQRREPKLTESERAARIDRAMARGAAKAGTRSRARWLAVAAAVLIAIGVPVGLALERGGSTPAPVAFSFGGPTDAIFGGPFADEQRASERMDRIAATRAHDYFAAIAEAAR